jgi:hypothetical protein
VRGVLEALNDSLAQADRVTLAPLREFDDALGHDEPLSSGDWGEADRNAAVR